MVKSRRNKQPYSEWAQPTLSPTDERFKKGERLFHYMQCQTCHVTGNEKDPAVLQQPKRPNLPLSAGRIQRPWARRWVQEPQTVQPGNPMASIFFSGRGIGSV